MNRRLRWKVIATIAVTLGISIFAWYPWLADRYGLNGPDFIMQKRLRLGLDLKGGVHMVLRVNTDDALLAETRVTAERVGEALARQGLRTVPVEVLNAHQFGVKDVSAEEDGLFRRASEKVADGFDRTPSAGGTYTFTMRPAARAALREQTVVQAQQTVDRRVNELGVVEPLIAVQGAARDQILVQMPGVTDIARAREILGTTALLEWKIVEHGPAATRDALLQATRGVIPLDTDVVTGPRTAAGEDGACYLVRHVAAVTGRDLRSARAIRDENNQPAVGFSLTPGGAERFGQVTGENVGRQLAIILDGRVESAPLIESGIRGGEGYIRGSFTQQQAADLSLILRTGALPASMTFLGGGFVGPSLGSESIRAGIVASLASVALIAVFLLGYYNRAGLNALASVAVNLLLLVGLMAYAEAVLTLPGIAGLILTIGMGVDSNVLIFERIKEELRSGKAARAAVAAGFNRVFLTILDTHAASLIAAAFLFQFGTGPIRGFATTLTFGLLANVFTAVFVSRTIFEVILSRPGVTHVRIETFQRVFKAPAYDFIRWRRVALACSLVVMLAGAGLVARRGVSLGLDFSGGTLTIVKFAHPVAEHVVQRVIAENAVVQRYGEAADNEMLIRLPQSGAEHDPQEPVTRMTAALRNASVPAFAVRGTEIVGPAMGADLQRKGVYATLASIAGITVYIALRFRPSFAVGAIAATLHDILITLLVVSACGYDLSLNVVAALLTITGYSVNDTIVVFDRVRETMRHGSLMEAVNTAVNQTLGRTVITAGTTFLAVLALFLFGGDVLEGFAFTMLVGIISGTYSTVFIAAAIAVMLSQRSAEGSARGRMRQAG